MTKMKKIIAAIVVLVLFTGIAYAETVNLKGMSSEELIRLQTSILQELMDRGEVRSATIPAGIYTIGDDIPAGSYSISTKQIMASIAINEYEQLFIVTPDDGVGKITLKDGDVFECSTTVVLTKYSGLKFE